MDKTLRCVGVCQDKNLDFSRPYLCLQWDIHTCIKVSRWVPVCGGKNSLLVQLFFFFWPKHLSVLRTSEGWSRVWRKGIRTHPTTKELKTSTVLCRLGVGWLVQPWPIISRRRAQRGTVQRFNHATAFLALQEKGSPSTL